jgi:hypothetical protein
MSEKETIFVLLDFDTYSYFHLCLISKLYKLEKFDFIGIISRKQDMGFFEKQKFMKKWEKEFIILAKTILVRSNEIN